MRPQDPKDVTRDTARDLSALIGRLEAIMTTRESPQSVAEAPKGTAPVRSVRYG
jgi:hypothetical protein